MTTEERIRKQRELIEEIGLAEEKQGLQPIAGRILGLLMVMDKERFSFDEIVEELQISKAPASHALRNLEIRGKIKYTTLPGDRKRYFEIRKQEKFSLIDGFAKEIAYSQQLIKKTLDLKADKNSANSQFYKDLIELMDFSSNARSP